ncbi:hypothetical protein SDC9_47988 [bioreactor metagenome]|uniref:Uncharacterized protein n=1 Tax=bioreactor metagenome TaxID=1076179 RepID=A0A644WE27_9ZZZZ
MQAAEQFSLTCLPISILLHSTLTFFEIGTDSISPFGQIFIQAPQFVHLSTLTLAIPLTISKASNSQTLTQLPSPKQPYEQDLEPPPIIREAVKQSVTPSKSYLTLAESQLPLHFTKAVIFSVKSTFIPKTSPISSAVLTPPTEHKFGFAPSITTASA